MSYKSFNHLVIKIPDDFATTVKEVAENEDRTIPEQIVYWADIGRQVDLRKWQLDEMDAGIEEAKRGLIATSEKMEEIFNKYKS